MKGLLGPLLVFIGGTMALALGLALLSRFWPLVVLGASLAVLHSPGALGLDWQHWEWGLVLGALVIQLGVFKKFAAKGKSIRQ